jgi:hypothetical protein
MTDAWDNPISASDARNDQSGRLPALTPKTADAEAILNRLQRNGAALTSCECGSRTWLPPDGVYQLTAVAASAEHQIPAKAVVPLTCAACGFIKLYDPAVVASLAESSGRW